MYIHKRMYTCIYVYTHMHIFITLHIHMVNVTNIATATKTPKRGARPSTPTAFSGRTIKE